jgi:hypothetical protein
VLGNDKEFSKATRNKKAFRSVALRQLAEGLVSSLSRGSTYVNLLVASFTEVKLGDLTIFIGRAE